MLGFLPLKLLRKDLRSATSFKSLYLAEENGGINHFDQDGRGEQIVIKYYNARKEGNKVEIIPESRG